jgi:1-acyl-sn-glycerol-3-phosphate acyltransferase
MSKEIKQSDGWLQTALKPVLLSLIKVVYWPKVEGRENIPKSGPTIIVANHKHDLDPFMIMSGRWGRKTHFLAKHECTDWKIGPAIGAFGVIFVDREAKDKSVVKNQVGEFMKKGRVIALFPEGTRNKTADLLMDFKMGAVSFAAKNNATLVPAAIVGEYKPFGRGGLKIVFGKPVKVNEADLPETNQKLYDIIGKLLVANGEEKHRPNIYKHYQAKAEKEAAKKGK